MEAAVQRISRKALGVWAACGGLLAIVGSNPAGAATRATTPSKPKTPTCSTVTVAQIKKVLGGSPTKPKQATSANVLICEYGTVDLIYLLKQTRSEFAAEEKSNKGTSVSGIGSAAFTYGAMGPTVISLEVFDGKVAFAISGSTVGLKRIEALAKVMLPLA
jgi:hypothetical protein